MNRNYMKLRQDFVRVCKDRAFRRMFVLMEDKHTCFAICTYTTLREIYALSEFTILNSQWPGYLLAKAKNLGLLYEDEFDILRPEIDEKTFGSLQFEVDMVFGEEPKREK